MCVKSRLFFLSKFRFQTHSCAMLQKKKESFFLSSFGRPPVLLGASPSSHPLIRHTGVLALKLSLQSLQLGGHLLENVGVHPVVKQDALKVVVLVLKDPCL